MVNSPLIRPYFLGGVALGGVPLGSYEEIREKKEYRFVKFPGGRFFITPPSKLPRSKPVYRTVYQLKVHYLPTGLFREFEVNIVLKHKPTKKPTNKNLFQKSTKKDIIKHSNSPKSLPPKKQPNSHFSSKSSYLTSTKTKVPFFSSRLEGS